MYKYITYIFFLSVAVPNCLVAQSLVVNEFVSENSTLADIDGEYSDWIELYNNGSVPVNLEGFGLSDQESNVHRWQFPNIELAPQEYLLVFASGKDYMDGELHTNYSIKMGGESLILSDVDGNVIDYVAPQYLEENHSFARTEDGGGEWRVFSTPSPNASNATGEVLPLPNGLVINEFMSNNEGHITDIEGETSDWLELYNASTESIDLWDYTLTDDEEELDKWSFPDITLGAGEFLLIFASGNEDIDGELHTSFKIKAEGEPLILSDDEGNILDRIPSQSLLPDYSAGRILDGGNEQTIFPVSSPGESNENSVRIQPVIFSKEAGHYLENFDLNVYVPEGLEIRYTLDASAPSLESDVFVTPLTMESRVGDPNYYSLFPCTEESYEPNGEVFKINIVRAQVFAGDVPVSPIATRTYMVDDDDDRYELPIISIVSDPDNLFDDTTGIYVLGSMYDGESSQTMNCFQKGREWERPMHVEMINETGELEFASPGGIRIHGGGSRRNAQKAFRLYARSDYGEDRFEYPFFDDKPIDSYKRLVLRAQSASNDSYLTDEVSSNLIQPIDVGRMAVRPVVVFVDGEFWGVYHIRERMDRYYLEDNYGVNDDDLTLLEDNPYTGGCCLEGDADEYINDVLSYVEENDVADDAIYQTLSERIDIDNFIDYMIAEFYVCNYDWPRNNVKRWKADEEGAKWQWLFFDIDFGLRFYERPSIINYIDTLTSNTSYTSTLLGRSLFENEDFQNQFISRFEYLLNNVFFNQRVYCEIEKLQDQVRPHMQEYFDRFAESTNLSTWEGRVASMKNYPGLRPCYLQEQIEEKFGVTIEIDSCFTLSSDFTCAEGEVVFDAAPTSLVSPTLPIEPAPQDVIVRLQNVGSETLTSVKINCTINDTIEVQYDYDEANLVQYQDAIVNLGTFDFGSQNSFEIKVWTSLPNGVEDENHENDTLFVSDYPNSLGGDYIVDEETGQFSTLENAVEFINDFGVGSTVTFNLASGIYDHFSLEDFMGNGCNNPVIFQSVSGDNNDVLIKAEDSDYALALAEGLSGVQFKNITFIADESVISLNGNNCIEFNNCTFLTNGQTSSIKIVESSFSNANFIDCSFQGGSKGIQSMGSSMLIENNTFEDQENAIWLIDSDVEINQNTITGNEGSTAIWIDGNSTFVNANRITGFDTGISILGGITDEVFIENNFIQAYQFGLNTFNTIVLDVSQNNFLVNGSIMNSVVLALSGNTEEEFQASIRYNNVVNTGGSWCLLLDTAPFESLTFEGNNFYTTGAEVMVIDDVFYATIEEVNAIFETNIADYSMDPLYTSESDLHINNSDLFYASTACSGNDIDGEERTNPCSIGADEVNFGLDMATIELVAPTMPITAGVPQIITVLVKNYGELFVNNFTIAWSVNDTLKNSYNLAGVNMDSNQESSIDLAQYTFQEDILYTVKFWVESPNDQTDLNATNDTLTLTFQACLNPADCTMTNLEVLNLQNNLRLYPNPTTDRLCIYDGGKAIDLIQIWSIAGELLMEDSNNCQVLDVSHLPKGTYIAKVHHEGEIFIHKVVVLP